MSKKTKSYPHIHNKKFYNHAREVDNNKMFTYVSEIIGEIICNWWNYKKFPTNELLLPYQKVEFSTQPRITWIGHSTFLIQVNNFNILTDPIFGNSSFLLPRLTDSGIAKENLPPIDLVLISHNHRDHMDKQTIIFLAKKNPQIKFLVPQGNKAWFDGKKIKNVYEKMWWEEHTLEKIVSSKTSNFNHGSAQINCTFLPAYHWSQRSLFDCNKSLWGSWMIETNQFKLYFSGDSAYAHHFKEIGQSFDSIDVAMIPIGPCEPERMRYSHTNAYEAGKVFLDLNAVHFIPMHWGTFFFGSDSFYLPIEKLLQWWEKNQSKLSNRYLHNIKCGEHLQLDYDYTQKIPFTQKHDITLLGHQKSKFR